MTVLIILGVIVSIFIIYYWFTFVIPLFPRPNIQGNASSKGSKWQYLGELVHPNSRHTLTIWSGTHPKILEWVRKEFTKRQTELQHWGDSVTIRGSYWEYLIQLQENRITSKSGGGTHGDDKVCVWRRRT